LNFHDLRRECASRWFEAGVPLATVSRLLGHKSLETTFIYLGVDEARLPEEVRRFEEARNGWKKFRKPTRTPFRPLRHQNCPYIKKSPSSRALLTISNGRGDWIRTSGLSVPNRALYQAEPRPG
jgi:hypothetical protein